MRLELYLRVEKEHKRMKRYVGGIQKDLSKCASGELTEQGFDNKLLLLFHSY